jgi:hypothetical protein
MTKKLKHIFKLILPLFLKKIIRKKINQYNTYKYKLKIIKTIKENIDIYDDYSEVMKIIKYLRYNPLAIFPYKFTKKYNKRNINVFYDNTCSMHYVLHDNKKLYFRRDWDKAYIQECYNGLLLEQDINSPHRYEFGDFQVKSGDIVVDIGAAEGNFALSVIEKVKKIYLFEVEKEWIEVLNKTFLPWKEKVCIINKFVTSYSDENCDKLDGFFLDTKIDFLKIDIEGAEIDALLGAKEILSQKTDIKIAICTYHKQSHAQEIKKICENSGFSTKFSCGYMIFYHDILLAPPYLRRGLIRAAKLIR